MDCMKRIGWDGEGAGKNGNELWMDEPKGWRWMGLEERFGGNEIRIKENMAN